MLAATGPDDGNLAAHGVLTNAGDEDDGVCSGRVLPFDVNSMEPRREWPAVASHSTPQHAAHGVLANAGDEDDGERSGCALLFHVNGMEPQREWPAVASHSPPQQLQDLSEDFTGAVNADRYIIKKIGILRSQYTEMMTKAQMTTTLTAIPREGALQRSYDAYYQFVIEARPLQDPIRVPVARSDLKRLGKVFEGPLYAVANALAVEGTVGKASTMEDVMDWLGEATDDRASRPNLQSPHVVDSTEPSSIDAGPSNGSVDASCGSTLGGASQVGHAPETTHCPRRRQSVSRASSDASLLPSLPTGEAPAANQNGAIGWSWVHGGR